MAPESKSTKSNPSETAPPGANDKNSEMLEDARQHLEGSLDTIKEILIGEHAREIQTKMGHLEERASRELVDVQNNTHRRFESLESFMRKELHHLREDVKKEQDERSKAIEQVSEEILRRYREIYVEIERTFTHLETRKPDRQFIGSLLMKMAAAFQAEPPGEIKHNVAEFKTKAMKKSG